MSKRVKIILVILAIFALGMLAQSRASTRFGSAAEANPAIQKLILSGKTASACKELKAGVGVISTQQIFHHCITEFAKAKSDPSICNHLGLDGVGNCVNDVYQHAIKNSTTETQSVKSLLESTKPALD